MAEGGSEDLPDVPASEDVQGAVVSKEEHHEAGEDGKQETSESTPGKSAKKVS